MHYEIITDNKTPFERKLTIKVESDSIEEVWTEELSRLSGEVEVKGFRQGKAPHHLVERQVGRELIWERVREVVAHRTVDAILSGSEKKPISPPKYDFDDLSQIDGKEVPADDNGHASPGWKTGQSFEFTASYLLPPPTPEEIEHDLMRGIGSELPDTQQPVIEPPKPTSTLPPDPRDELPGSGFNVDDN